MDGDSGLFLKKIENREREREGASSEVRGESRYGNAMQCMCVCMKLLLFSVFIDAFLYYIN